MGYRQQKEARQEAQRLDYKKRYDAGKTSEFWVTSSDNRRSAQEEAGTKHGRQKTNQKYKRKPAPAPQGSPNGNTILGKIKVKSSRTVQGQKSAPLAKYKSNNSGPARGSNNQLGGIPKKRGAGR